MDYDYTTWKEYTFMQDLIGYVFLWSLAGAFLWALYGGSGLGTLLMY